MSGQIKNVAASIRQRLKNKAQELNQPFEQILKYYSIERFLSRLAESEHANKFVLKGAQMLVVWRVERSRPTRDIDLLGFTDNSLGNLETIFKDLCSRNKPEEDAVLFDPATVSTVLIKEDADYEGVRVSFDGKLDTAALHIQIDVGFNDAVTPAPEQISYPSVLDFPESKLRGYNKETVIAEKFEAMVKLGELNSRMKDFFDIWLLSTQFEFEQKMLADALRATFQRRDTALGHTPAILSSDFKELDAKQKQWSAFLKKSKITYAPEQFTQVTTAILSFIGPVLQALITNSAVNAHWKPSGGWMTDAQ